MQCQLWRDQGLSEGTAPWDLQRLGMVWLHEAGIKGGIVWAAQPRRVHVVAHRYDKLRVHVSSLDRKQLCHLCLIVTPPPAEIPDLYIRPCVQAFSYLGLHAQRQFAKAEWRSHAC